MGPLVADLLDYSDVPSYLRGLTIPDPAVMAAHIVVCEYQEWLSVKQYLGVLDFSGV